MQTIRKWKCLNALHLKILAMVLMVCAHLWSTIIARHDWLDAIGRLAFPIFALISELPFNLMADVAVI